MIKSMLAILVCLFLVGCAAPAMPSMPPTPTPDVEQIQRNLKWINIGNNVYTLHIVTEQNICTYALLFKAGYPSGIPDNVSVSCISNQ